MNNIFDGELWAQVPFHFWSVVFFVFGSLVGSFLNVCIHRMPLGMSVVSPPSHCPKCKFAIPWYLNLPLITWLWIGGKCMNCKKPISVRYFIIELVTGLFFLFCWLKFGEQSVALALVYCVLIAGFIVGTGTDFEHMIIPDEITLGGAVAGVILSALVPAMHDTDSILQSLVRSIVGIAAGAGVLYAVVRVGKLAFGRQKVTIPDGSSIVFSETAVHLPDDEISYGDIFYRKTDVVRIHSPRVELADRCYWDVDVEIALMAGRLTVGGEELNPEEVPYLALTAESLTLPREAMGLGDVKLLATIGAFTGWQGALFSIFGASVIGSIIGVGQMVMKGRGWGGRLAFVPYLALAATVWIFFRDPITAFLFGRN